MDIIIDAMGGDNAPGEIVRGAVQASQKYKAKLILVGNKPQIEQCLKENKADARILDIVHTDTVITMEDDPLVVVRSKKDSSMTKGLNLLKEGADAFLSAGNTGALHVGSSLIIRTIKGVQRSGIATVLPFERPMLLMDSGANINVTADYLVQWAMMGSIYMKNVLGIKNPEIGLLNNGTEEQKGTQIQLDAFQKLKNNDALKFIGNIEGKDIPFSKCDVLVTDGFTGNITLKLTEGLSKYFFSLLKDVFTQNIATKMSFLVMKEQLRGLKHQFDSSNYGGAPLLGLQKPVIKAHGSSDAKAICNAVHQAEMFVETGVISDINKAMQDYLQQKTEE